MSCERERERERGERKREKERERERKRERERVCVCVCVCVTLCVCVCDCASLNLALVSQTRRPLIRKFLRPEGMKPKIFFQEGDCSPQFGAQLHYDRWNSSDFG